MVGKTEDVKEKNLKYLLQKRIICVIMLLARGGIAQLGERLVRIQEVRGSNPLISTTSAAAKAAA